MAVAFDVASGGPSPFENGDFSWTHTPSGTPKGVVVIIVQETGAADQVTGVTYGGVAMTRQSRTVRTTTEAGQVYIYTLLSGVLTGARSVAINMTSEAADDYSAWAFTVTASGDTEVADLAGADAGIIANPSLSISPDAEADIFYGIFSGLAAPVTSAETGTTHVGTRDYGADCAMWARKHVNSAGATTIGYTAASDDVCHAAIAIKEAGGVTHEGAAAVDSSGAVAPSGRMTYAGTSGLSASVALAPTSRLTLSGLSSLAANGAIAAVATVVRSVDAGLVTSALITPSARMTYAVQTVLLTQGVTAAVAAVVYGGQATFAGSGALSTLASLIVAGSSALTVTVTLSGQAILAILGQSSLFSVGSIAPTSSLLAGGAAALSAAVALAPSGIIRLFAVMSLPGIASLSAEGTLLEGGVLDGEASLVAIVGLTSTSRLTLAANIALLTSAGIFASPILNAGVPVLHPLDVDAVAGGILDADTRVGGNIGGP